MIFQWVIAFVALAAAFPLGYLISWMARDELLVGRKWFKVLCTGFAMIGILFLLFKNYSITLSSFFIFILSAVSHKKSFDKKWTQEKIRHQP
jgi:hypothetical protein